MVNDVRYAEVPTTTPPRPKVSDLAGGRTADQSWLPHPLAISLLAVAAVFLPTDRARWLVVVGGLIALSALIGAVSRSRCTGSALSRHPLVLLSVGLALTVSSAVLAALGPADSYVNPVALSAYPFLLSGLVALNGSRVKEEALDTLLVAAIVPSALLAFGWLPLVEAVGRWAGSSGETSWMAWLLLAVDALAVAIIARLAVLFRGKPVAYRMLLASMACMLGAHIAQVIGGATSSAPAPFGAQSLVLTSFALLAGASRHPSMRSAGGAKARADSIGRPHLLLLITIILVGPLVTALRYGERGSWVLLVAVGPAVVSLLVVAHLARLIRERQRLEYLSTHDSLTGLPNRTAFHDRLALLLGRAAGEEGPGVVFLDLDRFKHVNDSLGHDAGDELLRQVALRLRQCVRGDDTVARLAGDEFAVLLTATGGVTRAEDVARRILRSFAEPFHVTGAALTVSPSMGIASSPEHGTEVETLLRNADSAMYAAKAGGRNTARTFAPGMASATERHLLLEKRFRQAITDGELVVHYQPRVDTVTRRLVAVEALVRWDHPQLGLIPPGAFISMAESTGSIAELGTWVLKRACADAAAWWRAGMPLIVSVNVSPRQFALQDVPGTVVAALEASGLAAEALELELTESLHLSDDGSVTTALRHVHELGVVCAVDDFGTGYSSIAVLRDYPIGVVKLDQSFVKPAGGSMDAPLVRGVVQLARGLGMRVVAEGVENEAQMTFLAGILCDEIQGYLVSRAVPAPHIMSIIRDGGGQPSRVPVLIPVIRDVDERRLIELLWALQEGFEQPPARQPHELRFAAILGNAAMLMGVPIVLGMGAGGGLPPVLQGSLTSTLQAVGAEPPRHELYGKGSPTELGGAGENARKARLHAPTDSARELPRPRRADEPGFVRPSEVTVSRSGGKPTTAPSNAGGGKPTTAPSNAGGGKPTAPPSKAGSGKPTPRPSTVRG